MTDEKSHLGFTGTRKALSKPQRKALLKVFGYLKFDVFHHGDCVGADTEAHLIVQTMGREIRIHPSNLREEVQGHNTTYLGIRYPPKLPLDRNRDIVNACGMMIACPSSHTEEKRGSGTWYTIRYARKTHKPVLLIYPNGEMMLELNAEEP